MKNISFKKMLTAFVMALTIAGTVAPTAFVRAAETESEETSTISFKGQLIELSSTDVPTTIIVRKDPTSTWTDYTVDINSSTLFGSKAANTTIMSDWITGDFLAVTGTLNENTGVITATTVVNESLNPTTHKGLNGWVTATDVSASTVTVQWDGTEQVINITSNSHLVVGKTNPASVADLQVGDRVRGRLIKNSTVENEARILIVLRRGDEHFLKARTRGFTAEVNEIVDNGDGTGTFAVTLLANDHLREGDVNNLVGVEGDQLAVTYDASTKFVRKYNGSTEVGEFQEGDQLYVVGRVNDDTTISARLIKNTNIWQKGVSQHVGKVTEIDTDTNSITITAARGNGEKGNWAIAYTDETSFSVNGEDADESEIGVGDLIRVRGTARGTTKTIDAESITSRDTYTVMERLRDKQENRLADLADDNDDSDDSDSDEADDTSDDSDDSSDESDVDSDDSASESDDDESSESDDSSMDSTSDLDESDEDSTDDNSSDDSSDESEDESVDDSGSDSDSDSDESDSSDDEVTL